MDATTPWTETEIRRFLARERLGYQKIELPHGLATPGHDRRQAKEIAFSGSLAGKSVLDIGSYFGAFCIEALKRGASRSVGLELSRERIRVAQQIAAFLGLEPEYIRADIEDRPAIGQFDIVLCLNVLHHVRDVIGTLRYLALCTRERLLIEAEPPGRSQKHGLQEIVEIPRVKGPVARLGLTLAQVSGPSAAEVLNEHPTIYTAPCVPSGLNQSFYFTPSALSRILDGHMKLFQRIEEVESEFKGRFLLNCSRLRIDHMMVVAGVNGAAASTLCCQIKRNQFANQFDIADWSDAKTVDAPRIWESPLEHSFPQAHMQRVLYCYDLSLIDRKRLHSFRRDPATDVLLSATRVDVVIVAPTKESLRQELHYRQRGGREGNSKIAALIKLIEQPCYLLDLYSEWIEFCAPLNGRLLLYVERDDKQVLFSCQSKDEALVEIRRLYQ